MLKCSQAFYFLGVNLSWPQPRRFRAAPLIQRIDFTARLDLHYDISPPDSLVLSRTYGFHVRTVFEWKLYFDGLPWTTMAYPYESIRNCHVPWLVTYGNFVNAARPFRLAHKQIGRAVQAYLQEPFPGKMGFQVA